MSRFLTRSLFLVLAAALLPSCGGGGGGSTSNTILQTGLGSAQLVSLTLSTGTLSPDFTPVNTFYLVGPGVLNQSVVVTATVAQAGATILVNGVAVASGFPSGPLALTSTINNINVTVTSSDGSLSLTYNVLAIRDSIQGQQAYLKASNTGAGDFFGESVSISGDTMVVGARAESSNATGVNAALSGGSGTQADDSATFAGAAYVYTRKKGLWSQQAYLKGSNTEMLDAFGCSVAISGDTIVVGAFGESSNATGVNAALTGGSGTQADNSAGFAGAAYVYTRTGGLWSQQAYLKASNPGTSDEFGFRVSISGDTIVVGARRESSNATGSNAPLVGGSGTQADDSAASAGAAYVFTRTGGLWSQQAYLKASNTGAGDLFGESVSISEDTIVVGARAEASNATGVNAALSGGSGTQADDSATFAGAAYVYTRTGGLWSQQAYLKASNTEALDSFGCSVAISGDTIVVGAYGESSNATGVNAALTGGSGTQADNSADFSGAAYVFTRTGGLWIQASYLKASNTEATDRFGYNVAISGDVIVVGAHGEDSNATGVNAALTGGSGTQADNSANFSGAAYVFTLTGGLWSQPSYLKASNTEGSDQFGYSVAISGDTIVVGAYDDDSNATGVNAALTGGSGTQADNSAPTAGAVYVFK